MNEAEGEIGVIFGLGENVGDAALVANDLDRGFKARNFYRRIGGGQGRKQSRPANAAGQQN